MTINTTHTTISVSFEFLRLAEQYHLSWTEAARVGMAVLLQQAGAMNINDVIRERIQAVLSSTLLQKKVTQLNLLVKDMAEKIGELEKGGANDTT